MKKHRILFAAGLAAALAALCAVEGCRRQAGAGPAGAATPAPQRKIAFYRSPMDPTVHSETPAKDSMGMDFLPVYQDEMQGAGPVSGRSTVALNPERRQMLGVRSEPVRRLRLKRVIRTVGRVAIDEGRLHHIHTKLDGYVENLYVSFTGQFVRRGEPLLSIYSPELIATQQEYLLAYRAQSQLARSGIDSVSRGAADLFAAARERLLFWDIKPDDIATIERTGEVLRDLDLHSEVTGYVVQKMAFHGMRVTPADTLFDIADLTNLWVMADVYEADLPAVRRGMEARITIPFLPERSWHGPVTYVAPTVEEKTRTIKVRIEITNGGEELKPDMFADVLLDTDLGMGLVVPESAVIDAGERQIVFVDRQDGVLEPREVRLGARTPDGFQLLKGLAEGERVVISASFLIDSESSLKAALANMAPGAR
jgi:membrane fusion protein, copper/silver efflux system